MKERQLILSRIQTPDGTILTSYHRHDYVIHLDTNGETYFLDGGNDYQRVSVNKESYKDLSIWTDSPFEIIRQSVYRGGRGKDGKQPLKWIPMNEMSNEWLENCITYDIANGYSSSATHIKLYEQELEYRKVNNIFIEDYE